MPTTNDSERSRSLTSELRHDEACHKTVEAIAEPVGESGRVPDVTGSQLVLHFRLERRYVDYCGYHCQKPCQRKMETISRFDGIRWCGIVIGLAKHVTGEVKQDEDEKWKLGTCIRASQILYFSKSKFREWHIVKTCFSYYNKNMAFALI